jgi:hypothetical protein
MGSSPTQNLQMTLIAEKRGGSAEEREGHSATVWDSLWLAFAFLGQVCCWNQFIPRRAFAFPLRTFAFKVCQP